MFPPARFQGVLKVSWARVYLREKEEAGLGQQGLRRPPGRRGLEGTFKFVHRGGQVSLAVPETP